MIDINRARLLLVASIADRVWSILVCGLELDIGKIVKFMSVLPLRYEDADDM